MSERREVCGPMKLSRWSINSRKMTERLSGRLVLGRGGISGAICILLVIASASPVFAGSMANVIDRIRPGIVAVGSVQQTRRPPALFLGTGFAVADGRHIITNAHVLPQLDRTKKEMLAVFTGRGKKFKARKAQVVGIDRQHDLALLRIGGKPLRALRLGANRVREGDYIAFTGFPIGMVLGLYQVTHRGMVSAISPIAIPLPAARALNAKIIKQLRSDPFDIYQLDATVYPGNSGSPLFDSSTGRVVGVVNMTFVKGSRENLLSKPSAIGYAIPIKHARVLLKKAGL